MAVRPEDAPGVAYEAAVSPGERRSRGVHFTPAALADALVAWALDRWAPPGRALRVLDPAVGAGAFLLAVARHRAASGAPVPEILAGLHGIDLDPDAVSLAGHGLRTWAGGHGSGHGSPGPAGGSEGPGLVAGDGLAPVGEGPTGFDLVVGNPPFLGQLGRATRRPPAEARRLLERFGPAARGYVDTAALFLLAGLDRVRPGGRVLMVLPQSVLGADHAAGVRAEVDARARIVGLWVADGPVFDAAVDVCALCLERWPTEVADRARSHRVRLGVGAGVRPAGSVQAPPPGEWAPLLARARGVPQVPLGTSASRRGRSAMGSLADVAGATAGFRQHHYGLVPHLVEDPTPTGAVHPVATTGMVDPGVLAWGVRPARIGGRRWMHPAVPLPAVEAADHRVGAWLRARVGPKVLVAPQGRVVEAAVDPDGRSLPATPLITVSPGPDAAGVLGDEPGLVPWLLLAALSAPPVAAWLVERAAGTGRSRDAVRLSARALLAVPLPADRERWRAAAELLRAGAPVDSVAGLLTEAHGLGADHPVTGWWRSRRPSPPR